MNGKQGRLYPKQSEHRSGEGRVLAFYFLNIFEKYFQVKYAIQKKTTKIGSVHLNK